MDGVGNDALFIGFDGDAEFDGLGIFLGEIIRFGFDLPIIPAV